MKIFCQIFAMIILLPCMVLAVQPDEILADNKLEQRAREIGAELRCLVCQNQSIDDSDADLAHDLRVLLRQRLLAGDSDAQVKQYIVNRYGDYVLLKPPFNPTTFVLWFGPLLILAAALYIAISYYFTGIKQEAEVTQPLSEEETRKLAALLEQREK